MDGVAHREQRGSSEALWTIPGRAAPLVYMYPWQSADATEVYSDADWAGCVRTSKSASGGGLMLGAQGLGKLRHIDTQCLWIQPRVRDGTFECLFFLY